MKPTGGDIFGPRQRYLRTRTEISLDKSGDIRPQSRTMDRQIKYISVIIPPTGKDYLRPLPVKRYVVKEKKLMTVGKNSYVSLFKHHYSVPKEYVGRRMTILYDAGTVEIYCGMNLVAIHDRCDIPYAYSWKKEHNLPGHYGPYDKDLEELFRRASEIDNIVLNYLREVERFMQYPPKAFRSCRGILTLEKKYGRDRLVAACACADQKLQYG